MNAQLTAKIEEMVQKAWRSIATQTYQKFSDQFEDTNLDKCVEAVLSGKHYEKFAPDEDTLREFVLSGSKNMKLMARNALKECWYRE